MRWRQYQFNPISTTSEDIRRMRNEVDVYAAQAKKDVQEVRNAARLIEGISNKDRVSAARYEKRYQEAVKVLESKGIHSGPPGWSISWVD